MSTLVQPHLFSVPASKHNGRGKMAIGWTQTTRGKNYFTSKTMWYKISNRRLFFIYPISNQLPAPSFPTPYIRIFQVTMRPLFLYFAALAHYLSLLLWRQTSSMLIWASQTGQKNLPGKWKQTQTDLWEQSKHLLKGDEIMDRLWGKDDRISNLALNLALSKRTISLICHSSHFATVYSALMYKSNNFYITNKFN